jgi:hypothetical protein
MMPRLPDLVRDSELPKTTIHGKVTRHLFALPGKSSRQRKIWQEQRWQQVSFLGKGSYGDVWKEDLVQGGEGCRTRAVKVIRRTSSESATVDYVRELEAVAKFSQEKVYTSPRTTAKLLTSNAVSHLLRSVLWMVSERTRHTHCYGIL